MRLRGFVLAAFVLMARTAHADGGDAEALFTQGNALVTAGRYAEACPKLAESERLEPALGTRFNLADCYEHLGRTATAQALFLDVARAAHAAGKFERERLAKERAAALKVPTLRIDVKASASNLEILLDDVVVPPATWSAERSLDPGPHKVTATATGRTPFRWAGTLREGATIVTVPELAAPAPEKPVAKSESPTTPTTPTNDDPRRNLALGLGGVGIAGLAVGAIAGAIALSSKSRAQDTCPEAQYHFHCPNEAGANDWTSAHTAGNIATVGFIVGGVGLVAAAVVWLTAPKKPITTAWSF